MVFSLVSAERRRRLIDSARGARSDGRRLAIAIGLVVVYNGVGLLDIFSTAYGVGLGLGEEVNPILKAAMDHFGSGWIAAKLLLQLVISAMVAWFPHRLVLAIFGFAIAFNGGVVWSNLRIAGLI